MRLLYRRLEGQFNMALTDEEYDALRAKVREVGHLSELSEFIDFLALSPGCNWLDIKWGGRTLRLEIREETIRIIHGWEIQVEKDAINSLTVRYKNTPATKGEAV